MDAYDCARMGPVEAIQLPPPGECPKPVVHVQSSEKKIYTVLQEAELTRVQGRRCQGLESRLPLYCGTYDHQTLVSSLVEIDAHDELSKAACTRIWDDEKIKLGRKDYAITPNSTFQQAYLAVGSVSLGYNHVTCNGGRLPDSDEEHWGIVDTRYVTITTDTVTLAVSPEGTVTTLRDRIELPCGFGKKGCVTDSGTYLWENLDEISKCKLFKVRKSAGSLYTDNTGEKTFVSEDDTHIRLMIGEPTIRCGRMVFRTEHDNLFVTEEHDEPAFLREIDPLERSPLLYGSVQAAALEEKLASHVEEVISELKQESCRVQSSNHRVRYDRLAATQRATIDGETAALGEGNFATASGEGWYRYPCAHILVRAKDLDKCYNALPVELTGEDRQKHYEALGEPVNPSAQLWIEPHSHRILDTAAEEECSKTLSPLYRTAHGRWAKADPRVSLAATPTRLNTLAMPPKHQRYNRTNFATGGLYTPAAIREMNRVRQLPNVITGVEMSMGRRAQIRRYQTDTYDDVNASDVLRLHGPWWADPFGYLWDKLEHIGHVGSTIFGLFFMTKIITWAVGVSMRIYHGPTDPRMSWPVHIVNCLFPSLIYYLSRKWNQAPTHARLHDDEWTVARRLEGGRPAQALAHEPAELGPIPPRARRGRRAGLEALDQDGPAPREQMWLHNPEGEVLLPAMHFRNEQRRERWANEYAVRRLRRAPLPPAPQDELIALEPLELEDHHHPGAKYQAGPTLGPYENLGDIPAHTSENGRELPSAPTVPAPPSEPASDTDEPKS
jgi:hypothetical protein